MARIVLDTRAFVSAALEAEGKAARVLELVCDGEVELAVSPAIMAEYETVLRRKKFGLSAQTAREVVGGLRLTAVEVAPTETLYLCRDSGDDKFLECAQASGAAFLVAASPRRFRPGLKVARAVSPAAFLREIEEPRVKT